MRKIIDAADFFEPHIFARGEVISYSDAIKITDDYDVHIMMGNGDIADMN